MHISNVCMHVCDAFVNGCMCVLNLMVGIMHVHVVHVCTHACMYLLHGAHALHVCDVWMHCVYAFVRATCVSNTCMYECGVCVYVCTYVCVCMHVCNACMSYMYARVYVMCVINACVVVDICQCYVVCCGVMNTF